LCVVVLCAMRSCIPSFLRPTEEDAFFLELPKIDCDLVKWMKDNPDRTHQESRSILRGVLLGLNRLHGQSCVHMDIKPANVLVDIKEGTEPRAVVCDFESCMLFVRNADDTINTTQAIMKGTPGWLAPEVRTF
jgi:serine/threonine protein kinase